MKVVLTEKPSFAKDVASIIGANSRNDGYYEGNGFQVIWAFGHLFTLEDPKAYNERYASWNKEDLPIVPEEFRLKFTPNSKNKKEADPGIVKQFNKIKELLNGASEVINAGDAGREGELIQRWIMKMAGYRGNAKRLWISTVTEEAIREGFKNLIDGREKDELYRSGEARAQADWIVGVNATRALTLATGAQNVLSLGRLQTPVLALICERWLHNTNFTPIPYNVPFLELEKDGIRFKATYKGDRIEDRQKAEAIIKKVGETIDCSKAETKEKKDSQPLLFDLPSLQSEVNKRFGYTAADTLKIAQSLYETHKVLSYPRTDSRYISEDIYRTIPELLDKVGKIEGFGPLSAIVDKGNLPKRSVNDKKITDHHAIIPTGVKPKELNEKESQVFELVTKRFLAGFGPICLKSTTNYEFEVEQITFSSSGTVILDEGWRNIDRPVKEEGEENESSKELPKVLEGETLPVKEKQIAERKTKPLPIFTDATLIEAMTTAGKLVDDEELRESLKEGGLGTAATRAETIETVVGRGYADRKKSKLIPSKLGLSIYEQVKDLDLASAELTGKWEKQLNMMAVGQAEPKAFINGISEYTHNLITQISDRASKVKIDRIACPKCKEGSIIEGKKGYGCSAYKMVEKDGKKENIGCDFVVWKEIAGKKISRSTMEDLVKKGKTKELKGFKSKEENSFDAPLKLNDEFKVVFDFPEKENGQQETKVLGEFEGGDISSGIGKYGSYVKHKGQFYNHKSDNLDLEGAIEVIKQKREKEKKEEESTLRIIGKFKVIEGKYGPAIFDGKTYAPLPKWELKETTTEDFIDKLDDKKCKEIVKNYMDYRKKKKHK